MTEVQAPGYSRVADLDNNVRDFFVPQPLEKNNAHWARKSKFLVMQTALVSTSKDIGLVLSKSPKFGRN
jgi:hypothetical protein